MFYCNKCAEVAGWPITMFKSNGICEECKKTAVCNEMPSKDLPVSSKTPICQICGSQDTEKVCKTEIFKYGDHKVEVPDYESIKCNNCGNSVGLPDSVKRVEALLKELRKKVDEEFKNINKPVLETAHAKLDLADDSRYRRECPVCVKDCYW